MMKEVEVVSCGSIGVSKVVLLAYTDIRIPVISCFAARCLVDAFAVTLYGVPSLVLIALQNFDAISLSILVGICVAEQWGVVRDEDGLGGKGVGVLCESKGAEKERK